MVVPGARVPKTVVAVAAMLLGLALIGATILAGWGHIVYGAGVVLVAIGAAGLVLVVVRSAVLRIVLSLATAGLVLAVAVLPLTDAFAADEAWAGPTEGIDGWSARTGDLVINGGIAREVETGEQVWEHDDEDAKPLAVSDRSVVLGTDEESVGIEPTSGRELWRSPVGGRGIARTDDTVVIAHPAEDGATEAVGLDLATGEERWRRPGRPVMECELGPADRFSPAWEQSQVLLVRDEESENEATLLDVDSGEVSVEEVNCSLSARVIGETLVEAPGRELVGRAVSDGRQLWSVPVDEPWETHGAGSSVYVQAPRGVTVIEVATGQSRRVDPPTGTREVQLGGVGVINRAAEVWALADQGSESSLWNPGTGDVVEIPEATDLHIERADVSSGWIALSGTTRDVTGAEQSRCWAFSPDGKLSEPVPGTRCSVVDGLLQADRDVYPVP